MKDMNMPKDKHFGGIITDPASTLKYKTYVWRDGMRPHFDKEKCAKCMKCFINCPDNAIKVNKKGEVVGHKLDYCKGCGICAQVCPSKAITMRKE